MPRYQWVLAAAAVIMLLVFIYVHELQVTVRQELGNCPQWNASFATSPPAPHLACPPPPACATTPPPLPPPTCPAPPVCESTEAELCPWEFLQYKSSPWEQLWVDNAVKWGAAPCQQYTVGDNKANSHIWYDYAKESQLTAPAVAPDTDVFSEFQFKRTCTDEIKSIYIEPLALLTRNPLFCEVRTFENVVDKNYLLVDWEIEPQRKDTNGKTYYFDLGASTFNQGPGGTSQAFFVDRLERRGVKLDGIFAWEKAVVDPVFVFNEIPKRIWPVYHWYNIPANPDKAFEGNPLTVLKTVAKPEDMVIFKLDIDAPPVEKQFIAQIIEDPAVSSLIDVLFFEDHIGTEEMRAYFGSETIDFLKDLHDQFLAMRKLGIRAHSWM